MGNANSSEDVQVEASKSNTAVEVDALEDLDALHPPAIQAMTRTKRRAAERQRQKHRPPLIRGRCSVKSDYLPGGVCGCTRFRSAGNNRNDTRCADCNHVKAEHRLQRLPRTK